MKHQSAAPEPIFFKDDGITPNNILPVLLYRRSFGNEVQDLTTAMERCFRQNQWTNNWRDVVLNQDHYHSTTHEVLGISKGTVALKLGGAQGVQKQFNAGDVIVIPAGVAHSAINNTADYLVVGGYPFNLTWDMIYCEPAKYKEAVTRIMSLNLPITDPIYGADGYLTEIWKN